MKMYEKFDFKQEVIIVISYRHTEIIIMSYRHTESTLPRASQLWRRNRQRRTHTHTHVRVRAGHVCTSTPISWETTTVSKWSAELSVLNNSHQECGWPEQSAELFYWSCSIVQVYALKGAQSLFDFEKSFYAVTFFGALYGGFFCSKYVGPGIFTTSVAKCTGPWFLQFSLEVSGTPNTKGTGDGNWKRKETSQQLVCFEIADIVGVEMSQVSEA